MLLRLFWGNLFIWKSYTWSEGYPIPLLVNFWVVFTWRKVDLSDQITFSYELAFIQSGQTNAIVLILQPPPKEAQRVYIKVVSVSALDNVLPCKTNDNHGQGQHSPQ